MRTKALVLVAVALAVVAPACDRNEGPSAPSFDLTGLVTRTQAGVGPRGSPLPVASPRTRAGTPIRRGAMLVRVAQASDEIADCANRQLITVFWTRSTVFAPPTLVEDDGFPRNLVGRRVRVTGHAFGDAEGDDQRPSRACTLVADAIAIRAAAGGQTGGQTGGPAKATATPVTVTPTPTATVLTPTSTP